MPYSFTLLLQPSFGPEVRQYFVCQLVALVLKHGHHIDDPPGAVVGFNQGLMNVNLPSQALKQESQAICKD